MKRDLVFAEGEIWRSLLFANEKTLRKVCSDTPPSLYTSRICSGHKYPFSVKLWGYDRVFFRLLGEYTLCDTPSSYLHWSF
jgi:hypothetical protein